MISNENPYLSHLEATRETRLAERKRQFQENTPLDRDGRPTSKLAYIVLEELYKSRNEDISLKRMSQLEDISKDLLEIMFRQFEEMELITETSPGNFRYKLNSEKYEFQAKVEKWFSSEYYHQLDYHLLPTNPE